MDEEAEGRRRRRRNENAASLRWAILREALLPRHSSQTPSDEQSTSMHISRKNALGFNMINYQLIDQDRTSATARFSYTLPVDASPKLLLAQRIHEGADLSDFEISNRYNVDNTGLVCHWPSEDVLAYFCLSHASMFRSKRVIELGAGYGLAGLVIAATTEALEVIISDGNPQVVDYIQRNVEANAGIFGHTKVKSMTLHWDDEVSNISNSFDVIVASDCTFFKDFHNSLASTVKVLLRNNGNSEAIFFGPKRGDSLDKFLQKIEENGMCFSITEEYDSEIWTRHQQLMNGDNKSWPGYEKDHCYPLLDLEYWKLHFIEP
ncbi:Calmodulin-lysine N-methyltransferase [Euphorbia peplus]|nr:Calmodulin-lysine N-methyltransferase [Euphorbia peplus]